MKIRLLSDLHLEFYRDRGAHWLRMMPHEPADVLVLAGDIGVSRDTWALSGFFASMKSKYKHVVFVPGNHEYYGDVIGPANSSLKALAKQWGVHLLEPGAVTEIGGKRFLGGTLWFRPDPLNAAYARNLNDFSQIKGGFATWVYEEQHRLEYHLQQELRSGDIVVTHHLPHPESVAPGFKGDTLNRFFLCDMSTLIEAREPALWMHGHTHNSFDYATGKTRIVCNPAGYPTFNGVENASFNPNLIIEIP